MTDIAARLHEHWSQEIKKKRASIRLFESGKMRACDNLRDVTSETVEILRQQIAQLQEACCYLSAFGSPFFECQ